MAQFKNRCGSSTAMQTTKGRVSKGQIAQLYEIERTKCRLLPLRCYGETGQTSTVPSRQPAASVVPSGLNAIEEGVSESAANTRNILPDETSQNLIV
jgi:hypothetical protein